MKKYVNKILHLKVKEIIYLIILFLMVFYSFGVNYLSKYFSYIDDIFTVGFIFWAIIKSHNNKKLNKYEKCMILLNFVLLCIGLIGNIISGYQTDYKSIIVDIISCLKWFGIYLAGLVIFKDKYGDRYYKIADSFVKFILIIMLIIFLCNQIFHFGLGREYTRYGLPIYTLGGHPSYAASVASVCLSILLINYSKNKKWICLAFVLVLFTLRMKAIAYACVIILFIILKKFNKKFSIKMLIVAGLVSVILARSYITNYFFTSDASRSMALQGALKLARTFLPIGSGFATFGSAASTISYSKAYEVVGLSSRYGFRIDASSFVGDGGWATQIGQFGILGVILIFVMLGLMFTSVKYRIGHKENNWLPYTSVFVYMLICSTSEVAFASNYAVLFAIALVIIIKKGQTENEIRKKEK